MNRRRFLLAATLILVVPAAAPADELRGILLKVDPARKELTIEGRGRGARGVVLHVEVTSDTAVTLGKQPGRIEDLPTGKRVRVVYETRDGRRVAVSVTAPGPLVLGTEPPAGTPPPPAAGTVSGTLRRIGYTDSEIVIITPAAPGKPESETTFLVPQGAAITRDQKPIRFEDLKEGEPVVVRPEKREGKMVAAAINAGTAPPPGAPEQPKTERIERIRQILKTVDALLQMAQKQ